MCTRFAIEAETDELKEILSEVQKTRLADQFLRAGNAIRSTGEFRPSNVAPVLATAKNGARAVFPMRWGFQLPGRQLLVNARSETAAQKSTFREAWERHRCIIPASWYYEWEHTDGKSGQTMYTIQARGAVVIWLAGLYRMEEGLPVFAVLTREPAEALRRIHDRMPLILPRELVNAWIDPKTRPENLLKYAVTDMVAEKAAR